MAGHSKWKKIKRKKESQDQIKAKLYTKMAREISNAVKNNSHIHAAVDMAKANSVPQHVIDKALSSQSKISSEEYLYEGFICNVAVIIRAYPENKVKTSAEIKAIFNKYDGQLSSSLYLFDRIEVIYISKEHKVDDLLDLDTLEDIEEDEEHIILYTNNTNILVKLLTERKISILNKNIIYIPNSTINASSIDMFDKVISLLYDIDVVDEIFSNLGEDGIRTHDTQNYV